MCTHFFTNLISIEYLIVIYNTLKRRILNNKMKFGNVNIFGAHIQGRKKYTLIIIKSRESIPKSISFILKKEPIVL